MVFASTIAVQLEGREEKASRLGLKVSQSCMFPFSLSKKTQNNACRESSEIVEEFKKAYGGQVQVRTPGKQKGAKMVKGGR